MKQEGKDVRREGNSEFMSMRGDIVSRGECGRIVVFFFQAEDGIRDIGVTGVQTCALPI